MVTIEWIDSVPSTVCHRMNQAMSRMAKMVVVSASDTPKLSVRLSVMLVPTTLISTTASQYTSGT